MASADATKPTAVIYPDGDGKPMADNTLQFRWITTIVGGLEALFQDDPNVFVAGDLLWYPVEGSNTTRTAPDAMVAFGRPKGYRGSYRQWEEGGVAPQVVFEVLSPGNRAGAMRSKLAFYERFGVDEYYVYDPYKVAIAGYRRREGRLARLPAVAGTVSPRLGVRFDIAGGDLRLTGPDGKPFLTFVAISRDRDDQARRADDEARRADDEARRADDEARRADDEARRAEEQRLRAERLAARLRELGEDPV